MFETLAIVRSQPGISIEDISRIMRRSTRSIFRWLREIETDLGEHVECRGGGYYLESKNSTVTLDFTPRELLALSLSVKTPHLVGGSPLASEARSAWQKVKDAASNVDFHLLDELLRCHKVFADATAPEIAPEVRETLQLSLRDKLQVEAIYRSQSSGCAKTYHLNPYACAFRKNSWYLVAYCQEHKRVSLFKLIRFDTMIKTGASFTVPDDFSVDEYFKYSWEVWAGKKPTLVRVKFAKPVASSVLETKRHPTQKVTRLHDGSVLFEATVAGVEEIGRWLVGFGDAAVVQEPAELREYITAIADGALKANKN